MKLGYLAIISIFVQHNLLKIAVLLLGIVNVCSMTGIGGIIYRLGPLPINTE